MLYWQYFSPDGPAVDTAQLLRRLKGEEILLPADEVHRRLADGERMMAALLFPYPFLSAMQACG